MDQAELNKIVTAWIFIDRIEELARKDPKFNDLLGGVWRTTMTEEVWQRVQAVRTHVGEPANTPET